MHIRLREVPLKIWEFEPPSRRLVTTHVTFHKTFKLFWKFPLQQTASKQQQRTLKVGTHLATSCSNTSRRHITPCVQVGRLVAATRWGDTSQRQIASCVLENFCENLCLRNKILSLQQVAKNQIRLNLCDLLRRQNSVAATKIFTNFSSTHEAICRCNVSPRHVAATCRLECVPTFKKGFYEALVAHRNFPPTAIFACAYFLFLPRCHEISLSSQRSKELKKK